MFGQLVFDVQQIGFVWTLTSEPKWKRVSFGVSIEYAVYAKSISALCDLLHLHSWPGSGRAQRRLPSVANTLSVLSIQPSLRFHSATTVSAIYLRTILEISPRAHDATDALDRVGLDWVLSL
jgi:hypothetical protein